MVEIQFYSRKTQVLSACKVQLDGHTVTDLRIARLQRRFGMTKAQARVYADLFSEARAMCERYKFTFKDNRTIMAHKGLGAATDEAAIRPIHIVAARVCLALNTCGGR